MPKNDEVENEKEQKEAEIWPITRVFVHSFWRTAR